MKKVVFFDIDGTLTTEMNQIPETTVQAINQLKERNIRPIIATGRPPLLIEEIAKELAIDSYIAMNGQYVVFEGETIYANPIAMELVDEVVNFANSRQDGIVLCTEKELIVNSFISLKPESFIFRMFKKMVDFIPERTQIWLMDQAMKQKIKKSDYQDRNIFMMNLTVDQESEKDYKRRVGSLGFTRANIYSMDIVNEGVSKASAIEEMLTHLDIGREDSFAFGDGLNDLEMLQYVGTGIAMENGFQELKDAADFVTTSVSNDGIQKALKKLKLI